MDDIDPAPLGLKSPEEDVGRIPPNLCEEVGELVTAFEELDGVALEDEPVGQLWSKVGGDAVAELHEEVLDPLALEIGYRHGGDFSEVAGREALLPFRES